MLFRSGDREIGVLRNVEPPTRPRLECLRETGLILRCDRKVENPFCGDLRFAESKFAEVQAQRNACLQSYSPRPLQACLLHTEPHSSALLGLSISCSSAVQQRACELWIQSLIRVLELVIYLICLTEVTFLDSSQVSLSLLISK